MYSVKHLRKPADAGPMNRSYQSSKRLMFAITMLAASPSLSPAQVRILISGGFSAAYQELLPRFEKSTGITVTTAQGAWQTSSQVRERPRSPAEEWRWWFCR
jgi:ABC-type molybdate transport system substrate-binding protein